MIRMAYGRAISDRASQPLLCGRGRWSRGEASSASVTAVFNGFSSASASVIADSSSLSTSESEPQRRARIGCGRFMVGCGLHLAGLVSQERTVAEFLLVGAV